MTARQTAVAKSGRDTYEWQTLSGAGGWHPVGEKQVPAWLPMTRPNSRRSLKDIEETPLVWGTIWGPPLMMALSMNPPPDVIFFMTDGFVANQDDGLDEVIKLAKRTRTKINTIAMMEPRAEAKMKQLARATGGEFSMVMEDGTVVK